MTDFSRYEVYTTVQSIYCYRDSKVLRNKLHIRNAEELKRAEEEITAIKQYKLYQSPISGRFSKSHLLRIHRYLFEDIYPFAGHIRRESISKGSTQFYPPNLIERELEKFFSSIHDGQFLGTKDRAQQINNLSFVMAELNIIHPFREGNGRTIREFTRCLAMQYGLKLNWGNIPKEEIMEASILSVDDAKAFSRVLERCIE